MRALLVTLEPGDLAPILYVELIGHGTEEEGLPGRVKTWLEVIEAHYGIRPMLYTDIKFWNQHFGAEAETFAGYPLSGVEKAADLSRVNRSLDWRGWWL